MTENQLLKILFGILNRGIGQEDETKLFEDMKHNVLIEKLASYLNVHRHFLGSCQIEQCHALNDKGVDILLVANTSRIGFQLKSHHDVSEDDFAAKVKRQWAESHTYGLTHYFILICAPLQGKKYDYSHRVSHILNELNQIKGEYHTTYGPRNAVQIFRDLPPISRNELLLCKAIDGDCLQEHEKGYEHLPEVSTPAITAAEAYLDSFGDNWPDSQGGRAAFDNFEKLVQAAQAAQFKNSFLPSLTHETRQQRNSLVNSAVNLLAECRHCKSWNERSEYKLAQWLDNIPEVMIPYTSLPNLLRIQSDLTRYLEIHRQGDAEKMQL